MNAALQKMFEMIGSDHEVMAELVESYLEETPQLLERMHVAINLSDAAALGMAAHTLKGTARDFGADRLANLCLALEDECHHGFPQSAKTKIEAIELALRLSHSEMAETNYSK
jgi:histidine phosphotransfer protein HptB